MGVWVGRADGAPVPGISGVEAAAPLAGGILARVERGRAPFTWFADGVPVAVASFEREERLALEVPGFVTLSVVDAEGSAAQVAFEPR